MNGINDEKHSVPLSSLGHSTIMSPNQSSPGSLASSAHKARGEPVPMPSAASAAAMSHMIHGQPQDIPWYDAEPFWVAGYFFFNLALTIYNKIALNTFPYPWALTSIHSACATLGCYWCERRGFFKSSVQLGRQETLLLVAFSTLYTVNIAVSNLSLNLVSVPLHQVIRSLTPLFTIIIAVLLFKRSYQTQTYLSLVPVILGVALATQGDYSATRLGFCLTLLSALLASIKGHATNKILVGRLRFHPLELLLRMSPLAFAQCIVFSFLAGEPTKIYEATFVTGTLTSSAWGSLMLNGAVAFGLNVVSFTANKKAGALTMDVAANVKQVLTIVLAVAIFDVHINATNLAGIALTIAGGAYYSYIEYCARRAKNSASSGTSAPGSTLRINIPPPLSSHAAHNGEADPFLSQHGRDSSAAMSAMEKDRRSPYAETSFPPLESAAIVSTGQDAHMYIAGGAAAAANSPASAVSKVGKVDNMHRRKPSVIV